MGYARGRAVAVSPVNPRPFKTLFHELAHELLGHKAKRQLTLQQSEWKGQVTATKGGRPRHVPMTTVGSGLEGASTLTREPSAGSIEWRVTHDEG